VHSSVQIDSLGSTWPFGHLEISNNQLIVRDEMFQKKLELTKGDIIRIEIKKYLPIVGYGIKIYTKKNYNTIAYFWYWSFRFKELVGALKECGWL